MNTGYKIWINKRIKTQQDALGKCELMCKTMRLYFPELIIKRGRYIDPIWGKREHWWLVTESGDIVDPTALQFPSKGCGEYVELDESQPEPTRICANCGSYCYDGAYFCSDECEDVYMGDLSGVKSVKDRGYAG